MAAIPEGISRRFATISMSIAGLKTEAIQAELRKRGLDIKPVTEEEREWQRQEVRKCAEDVKYWFNNYVYTYDPRLMDEPYIKFRLFPRQEACLDWLEERQTTQTSGCIEKSRDVGVSELFCGFCVHRWQFYEGFAAGIGSRKLDYVDSLGDPKALFEKMRRMIRRQPPWLIPPGFNFKEHSFEGKLINPRFQSTIIGEGGTQIGRGGRTSLYGLDEYNFLEHPELADAALSDNTNVTIYMGSPNGLIGIYEKRNYLPTFRFHWHDDPRKNLWTFGAVNGRGPNAPKGAKYPWYEAKKEKHRDEPWIVKQEVDIDYLGSGFPRFDRTFLESLLHHLPDPILVEEPGVSGAWSATVKTWRFPERRKEYLIVSDVAEGESNSDGDPDFSVSHVYDTNSWEQVCTYRGRPDTHAYAVDLAALGELYNWAAIAVERTGPGVSTIKTLTEEFGYPNVIAGGSYENYGTRVMKPGIVAGHKQKTTSESELAGYIGDMAEGFPGFKWNDKQTILELIHFTVKPNGRAEAEKGWHDDEVTCCKIAAQQLPLLTTRRREMPTEPPAPRVLYGNSRRR